MSLFEFYSQNDITTFEDVKEQMKNMKITVKYDEENYLLYANEEVCDMTNPITRQCQGIILNKEKIDQVVCYSSNKTEDIVIEKNTSEYEIKTLNMDDWESFKIQQLVDGTLIRVYYHNGGWKTSTKKVIDAVNSYWNSEKSFAEMFQECAEETSFDYAKLSTDSCYYFIIKHPENRNISKQLKKDLVHVGSRNLTTLEEFETDLGIQKPLDAHFDSFEKMVEVCKQVEYSNPGYMIMDSDYNRVKVQAAEYNFVKELKGNMPNMKIRFLYLREKHMVENFLFYFPEYTQMFQGIEESIRNASYKVYQTYVTMRIKKQQVELSPIDKDLTYLLHGEYLQTRNKVSMAMVMYFVNQLSIAKLGILVGLIKDKRLQKKVETVEVVEVVEPVETVEPFEVEVVEPVEVVEVVEPVEVESSGEESSASMEIYLGGDDSSDEEVETVEEKVVDYTVLDKLV